MVTASSMQRPAGLAGDVRLGSLTENEEPARQELFARVTAGTPHEDMRDWLEMVDAIGELRVLEGVDADENIGRIAEMLHHTDGAPAVLFTHIPGYEPGYRILVNAQGERRRLAVSLGLPVDKRDLTKGGNDIVKGSGGDDIFTMGAALTAQDGIDGGTGSDTLALNGDYATSGVMGNVRNVEVVTMGTGHDYTLSADSLVLASGQAMTIDASVLGAANHLTFNASTDSATRTILFKSGAGSDSLNST